MRGFVSSYRLGERYRWVAGYLCIALLMLNFGCGSTHGGYRTRAQGCAGIGPAWWYGREFSEFHRNRLQRMTDMLGPLPDPLYFATFEATNDPRDLQTDRVLEAYSEAGLECWASNGDQLAQYALGTLWLRDDGGPLQERGLEFLRLAANSSHGQRSIGASALPGLCNSALSDGRVACAWGLPEAQRDLGRYLCSFQDEERRSRGSLLLWAAYEGGLWPAKSEMSTYCV